MAYPTGSEYQDAIVNAKTSVLVPELKNAVVYTNKMRLPISWCGNYAIVFRVSGAGGHDWAVRCFMADVPDALAHYEKVSRFIAGANLPNFLEFKFHQRGIRVRGREFPIIQMPWAAGVSIKDYIKTNLAKRQVLEGLADKWRAMLHALQSARVAHGDLQHGNVLVEQGPTLKLIDYDSMVLPNTIGKPESNCGLPAYQHPNRNSVLVKDPAIDNFSALVIYLSIRALMEKPSLWTDLNTEKREGLLFDVEDFTAPNQSTAFASVKKLSPEVKQLAIRLEQMCKQKSPTGLESLNDVVTAVHRAAQPVQTPIWLAGAQPHQPQRPPIMTPTPTPGTTTTKWPSSATVLLLLLAIFSAYCYYYFHSPLTQPQPDSSCSRQDEDYGQAMQIWKSNIEESKRLLVCAVKGPDKRIKDEAIEQLNRLNGNEK